MTRSVVLRRTSPGRFVPSVWGITLLAMLFGGATLLPARTALAKKKKAETTQQTDDAAPGEAKPEKPAEQAGDVEKPKTILDTSQEAPKTDSLGHVHFGSPNGEGLGRVAVKAAPESKIKIFLEGRYFGTAPLTIYSVPKGDYIVEAMYPNGKQISKPVSVGENEETAVGLGGAAALKGGGGPGMFDASMTEGRMTVTKVALLGAGVGVVATLVFGILELKAESDYDKETSPAVMDDIAKKGRTYAILTNVGIVLAAVGLVTAGIAGYPLVLGNSEKPKATAFQFTPSATPNGGGGVFTWRF